MHARIVVSSSTVATRLRSELAAMGLSAMTDVRVPGVVNVELHDRRIEPRLRRLAAQLDHPAGAAVPA